MFIYSVKLTLVVLISIPVYVLIASMLRPILREQINEKFNRGARSQQFLVEWIVGAQTLKAASVEPMMQAQWEERLASYVRTSFDAGITGALGQNMIQYVSKVTTALILFVGAQAVIQGSMSVGELIAFNMIASQVSRSCGCRNCGRTFSRCRCRSRGSATFSMRRPNPCRKIF